MFGDLVEGVEAVYREYGAETGQRVWQSVFKIHNQVLKAPGGSNCEMVEHVGDAESKPARRSLSEILALDRFYELAEL